MFAVPESDNVVHYLIVSKQQYLKQAGLSHAVFVHDREQATPLEYKEALRVQDILKKGDFPDACMVIQ